ncbi:Trypsin [Popillia japonica]|uniref:Trypsin n=1 Tax=Popillia japonica TaxID=7064 RepID=A0AAW1LUK5_POPJA
MFYTQIIPLVLLFETIIDRQLVTSQLQEDEICITSSGKPGKCVLIEKCPAALALVRNRGRPQVCSFQGRSPIVCCEGVVSRTQSIAAKKCLLYRKPNLIATESRIPEGTYAAVGGQDAEPLEFPHMAILGYGDPNNTKWLCGGSLISENFVLTAAHCIYTRYGSVTIIKLGVHQLSETNIRNKLPNGLNDDWQICADGGGARADTCQGDSGGPIQLSRDENVTDLYTIIGITSFGIKCAVVPAVYTRISYYVPWIESIVWPN